jgi:cell division protein FtsQ
VNLQPVALDIESPARRLFRRRHRNRRVIAQRRSLVVWLGDGGVKVGRALARASRVLGRVLLVLGVAAACGWGGRWAIARVVDSPRFQIRSVEFSATPHLGQEELLRLASLEMGEPLLGIDTDQVARRIASHPWVATVRVSRRLPSSLVIEVSERHAVAAVALSGLYLVERSGRPFKRASMEEADGLPVLTGIERGRYAQMREVSEAAFREALAVLDEYRSKSGRPTVGEVNIDPGYGFSLFLLEGGAEIRLGRGDFGKKLAQLDQIFDAVLAHSGGLTALRIVQLDLPESGRVPVLLRDGEKAPTGIARPTAARPANN